MNTGSQSNAPHRARAPRLLAPFAAAAIGARMAAHLPALGSRGPLVGVGMLASANMAPFLRAPSPWLPGSQIGLWCLVVSFFLSYLRPSLV